MSESNLSKVSPCPTFDGDKDKFEDWAFQLHSWMFANDHARSRLGVHVHMALTGVALSVVRELGWKQIAAGGVVKKAEDLGAVYLEMAEVNEGVYNIMRALVKGGCSPDPREHTLTTYRTARDCRRKPEETMTAFLARYKRCKGARERLDKELLESLLLLDLAGIPQNSWPTVLDRGTDGKELTFDGVTDAMLVLFPETTLGTSEAVLHADSHRPKPRNPPRRRAHP